MAAKWDPNAPWSGEPKAIVFTDFDGTITLMDSELPPRKLLELGSLH